MGRLVLVVALAGCLRPREQACSDGLVCPPGDVCDDVHQTCVTPDQVAACAGAADRTACTAGAIDGECVDGICFKPGCGNHVVESWLGEQCDPPGPHCSADCSSNLTCGNGIVDATVGEQCDDGNLASHDGCDSRCQLEQVAWRAIVVAPPTIFTSTAFDAARGRLVGYVDDGTTWEWDGAAWTLAAAEGSTLMPPPQRLLVYDSDHQRVAAVDLNENVFAWDGTAWTMVAAGTGLKPSGVFFHVAYDSKRHQIYAFGSQPFYIDPTTGQITLTAVLSGALFALAFDSQRGIVVALTDKGTQFFDGSSWSVPFAGLPNGSTFAVLVDDPALGGVVALQSGTPTLYAWNEVSWNDIGAPNPFPGTVVAWADARDGSLDGVAGIHAWKLVGANATVRSMTLPNTSGSLVYDPGRDVLVLASPSSAPAQVWHYDTTWRQIATTTAPASTNGSITFDPIAGVAVAIDTNGATWTLGDDWQRAQVAPFSSFVFGALAYDYGARRVMLLANDVIGLPSGASAWQLVAAPRPLEFWMFQGGAYDRGLHDMVGLNGQNSAVQDFVNGDFVGQLSLGTGYQLVADAARGSIVMYPGNYAGGGVSDPPLWERRDGVWTQLEYPPVQGPFASSSATEVAQRSYGRIDAEVALPTSNAVVLVERQWTSATPDETCVPGVDADGDGLAGCDDPDCWWACHPACPYQSSCN